MADHQRHHRIGGCKRGRAKAVRRSNRRNTAMERFAVALTLAVLVSLSALAGIISIYMSIGSGAGN